MTTLLAPQPTATKTPAQAAYSGARRATAAKWGWATRRYVPEPTPELLARTRLEMLLATLDTVTIRRYACQVALTVAHHYSERYPGDLGCDQAIHVAQRLAAGTLSERGRRRASTASRKLVTRAGADAGSFNRPFHSAANAAAWCLARDAHQGAYWALIWAAACAASADRAAALERYGDDLAALARAGWEGEATR